MIYEYFCKFCRSEIKAAYSAITSISTAYNSYLTDYLRSGFFIDWWFVKLNPRSTNRQSNM